MKHTNFVTITAFFLVSGCGGGGSSAVVSPEPTLPITSNNAMEVGKIAYEAALESQQLDDAGGGLLIGSTQGLVVNFDKNLEILSKPGSPGTNISQIPIPPETVPCAQAGMQTISGDIADIVTPTLTAGDWFQIVYSACDDGLGEIKDGTVRLDIDAFNGDFLGTLNSMTFTLTLTNFQVSIFENQSPTPTDVITSNGGATLSVDALNFPSVSTNVSGISLVVDANATSESLTNFMSAFSVDGNLIPSPYSTSASGTLDSTQLAGVIRYSNPVTFTGLGGEYPSSGEFLVEGLDSTLRLIAVNNVDVLIEIDLGADGTVDDTINTTWAALTSSSTM